MSSNDSTNLADPQHRVGQQTHHSAMQGAERSTELAISARGLCKRYQGGRITALGGLDLDVSCGEFVAICGPSGCGKSTLLNLIAAVDRPDSGELTVLGQRVTRLSAKEADEFRGSAVGLVFQL